MCHQASFFQIPWFRRQAIFCLAREREAYVQSRRRFLVFDCSFLIFGNTVRTFSNLGLRAVPGVLKTHRENRRRGRRRGGGRSPPQYRCLRNKRTSLLMAVSIGVMSDRENDAITRSGQNPSMKLHGECNPPRMVFMLLFVVSVRIASHCAIRHFA